MKGNGPQNFIYKDQNIVDQCLRCYELFDHFTLGEILSFVTQVTAEFDKHHMSIHKSIRLGLTMHSKYHRLTSDKMEQLKSVLEANKDMYDLVKENR